VTTPLRWRLLLFTGQSITVEATWLRSTDRRITLMDGKTLKFSLPTELVLLIELEGHSLGVTDAELLAAWDKAHSAPPTWRPGDLR